MTQRPNLLLITDDQHRFDFFGRTGAVPALRTPNWDRLAAAGTVFERSYSNCPICMPCRFTWLYGLYASQATASLLKNAHSWPTDLTSMAHLLQGAGYSTALIGKLHSKAGLSFQDLRDEEPETRARGFDHVTEVSGKALANWFDCRWTEHLESRGLLEAYRERFVDMDNLFKYSDRGPLEFEPEDTMDGFIGAQAQHYLKKVSTDAPFFCHASFCAPHFPLDPPEKYWERYRDAEMPPPEGVTDAEEIALWQQRRRAYCALIEQLDDEIGALLSVIEKRGLSENTLVLYACDHGDMLGWRGRPHKGEPYEFSARTPLIAVWPNQVLAGHTSNAPVEAVDLPATILDAAGVTADIQERLPQSPGRSFLPIARGEKVQTRGWSYSEGVSGERSWRMCYRAGWKYIQYSDGESELYDLNNDPLELEDIGGAPEHAARISELRHCLLQSMMVALPPDKEARASVIRDPRAERRRLQIAREG